MRNVPVFEVSRAVESSIVGGIIGLTRCTQYYGDAGEWVGSPRASTVARGMTRAHVMIYPRDSQRRTGVGILPYAVENREERMKILFHATLGYALSLGKMEIKPPGIELVRTNLQLADI